MSTKPLQDLSLLPGEYYHRDAQLHKGHYRPKGILLWRGHRLYGDKHGVWEWYYKDGILERRENYLHGTPQGVWEWYREDGTLGFLECYSEGNLIPFFIESLLDTLILDI